MTDSTTPDGKSNRTRWFTAAVIGLMIVLMAFSSNTINRASHSLHGVLVGTSNAGDLMGEESQYASRLLEELQSIYVMIPSDSGKEPPQPQPLLSACWGDSVYRDLKANPDAFALVIRESRRISPGASPLALGTTEADKQSAESLGIFNSGYVEIDDLHPLPTSPLGIKRLRYGRSRAVEIRAVRRSNDGRNLQLSPNTLPPLEQANMYAALNDFLIVQAAASLPLSAVKTSSPIVDRFLSSQYETFTVQMAGIDAAPLLPNVKEPSDDDLRAQLAAYAAEPRVASATNPFGFGYRVPDGVKLELISYKRADVRKVVEAEKTPYEWEVAARLAYAKDPHAFTPSTQPTTVPAIPVAFESVREKAIAATIDRVVDQRSAEIEKAIRSPMSVDYQLWSSTAKKSASTTGPSATPIAPPIAATVPANGEAKVSYDSNNYLYNLAATIKKQHKVQLTVELYTDRFRSRAELAKLGFNDAKRSLPIDFAQRVGLSSDEISVSDYALGFAKDLLDAKSLDLLGGLVLERYRPSERVEAKRGSDGSDREVFFFRITDTERNHPGKEIDSIREVLKSDWRTAQAQKLAVAKAQTAVDAIKNGSDFDAAVKAATPDAIVLHTDIGPFYSPPSQNNGLGLLPAAYQQLGLEFGDKLLGTTDLAVLDVPLGGKAYIAKRLAARGEWETEDDLRFLRQQVRSQYVLQMSLPAMNSNPQGLAKDDLAATWLDPKQVYERYAFVKARPDDDK